MKGIYFFILCLFVGSSVLGQTNLITVDFETANVGYTPNTTIGTNYMDVFNRINDDLGAVSNETGYYWAVEDVDGDPYMDLSQVDITGYTSFTFSIDMVTHHYNDWDAADELLITYSIDGGTYQNLMWVQNDGSTYNTVASLDTDFDGNGECTVSTILPALSTGTSGCTVSTSDFATFTTSPIILSGNSTLDIKIEVKGLNATDEGIYFDNIKVDASSSSCTLPSTQPSLFNASSISSNSMDISFTRGDGDGGVIVLAKAGSAVDEAPSSGTTYTANSNFGTGDELGTGNFVIYNGVANGASAASGNISISNLAELTTYHFAVYEYNASGTCYDVIELASSATTLCVTPVNVTSESASAGNSAVTVSWTDSDCFDEYLVVACTSYISGVPVSPDGSHYTANAVYSLGDATQDFSAPEYPVYKGAGSSVTVTGLTNGTDYFFKIFTRKGTTWSSGVELNATPQSLPSIYISEISDAPSSFNNEFIELYNNTNSAIDLTGYKIERLSSTGTSEYIYDIGSDEVDGGTGSEVIIPAHGFIVIARGTTSEADFDLEFSHSFPTSAAFNRGNTNLFFGTGRTWKLRYSNGTSNTADGTVLDETGVVAASGERDYQNSPGVWVNSTAVTATPGNFETGQALPVELLHFSAKTENLTVVLSWSTATEEHNAYFDIERSIDGIHFEKIGTVQGSGTSYDTQEYSFTDENPVGSTIYYRLKQVDYDGAFQYHNIVAVNFKRSSNDIDVFSVLGGHQIDVVLTTTSIETLEISIFDINGQLLKSLDYFNNYQRQTIDISELQSGVYLLRAIVNGQVYSKSFVKF